MTNPYAVVTIDEDGYIVVFGPYAELSTAYRVVAQAEADDVEQKLLVYAKTLYLYETEGGTVVE